MLNIKRKSFLFIAGAIACLPMLVSAETVFEEVTVTYDGGGIDPVNSAAVDLYGNMYVSGGRGNSAGAGAQTYYTAKYDSYGREQWVSVHSTGQSSWFGQSDTMVVDRAGNAYVAISETYNFGKLLKYDADGNESVLMAGGTSPSNHDHRIGLVLDKGENNLYMRASSSIKKISLDGGAGWTKPLLNWNTWVRDIAVDDSGNVYAAGVSRYTSGNSSSDVVVSKFDGEGNLVWSQLYYGEGVQNEDAYGLELDADGNVYVLVQAVNYEDSCKYCVTTSVVNFSTDGELVGSVDLNGVDGAYAGAIKLVDGKIYATMETRSSRTVMVQKLNADLSLVWSTEYSGGTSKPRGLDVDGLGNVIVGAQARYNNATVKFDMYGNELWTQPGVTTPAFLKFGVTGEVYVAESTGDAVMHRYGVTQLICQ